MTDGRTLFAGGRSDGGTYSLWRETNNDVLEVTGTEPPTAHRARLLPDGRVALLGGTARRALVFDPSDAAVRTLEGQLIDEAQFPGLAVSFPAAGETDVPVDTLISLRFARRMGFDQFNDSTVTLIGPGGSTPIDLVSAEEGRLLFVSPKQELFPGSAYTLVIEGVKTAWNEQLETVVLDFRTETLPVQPLQEASTAASVAVRERGTGGQYGKYCQGRSDRAQPCNGSAALDAGIWTPGLNSTDGRWRIPGGTVELPTVKLMTLMTHAIGATALTGQILQVDNIPVANVEVSIGARTVRTDNKGRFWMLGAPAGRQEIYVDGTTANSGDIEYGQFVVGADLEANTLTQLPYVMYLPRIAARDKIRIESPLKRDVVMSHPDMPGLQVHIPAGTVIRDRKGKIVRELAIVPTPVNRAPFPVAANYPMYFTLEPGGAVIQGLLPESARGIRVLYPNYDGHAAGTQADFWIYDPAEGWRVYGKGRVTSDESRFAPEAGVALHQTMGGSYSVNTNDPAPEEDLPPDCQTCGEGNAGTGQNATAGDPIDLRTGQFSYQETDISIADITPIVVGRSYSPRDLVRRDFGIGTASNFGHRLHAVANTANDVMQLVFPNGAPLLFNRVSGSGATGTWQHYGTTVFSGALLQTISEGGYKYRVTLRDGSAMQFSGYSPNRLVWTQDSYGNRTEYIHTAGLVTRIVSPSGRYVDIEYDGDSRINKVRDLLGSEWTYQYRDGFLRTVIYPDGSNRQYHHESYGPGTSSLGHRISAIFDRRGNRLLHNEWSADLASANYLRATRQTLADGSVYEIDYAHEVAGTRGTLVTHPDGSRRRVVFDNNGGAYPISDTLAYGTPLEQTYRFERNSLGQMTARIDPLGRRTEFTYNSEWQTTQITQLAGTANAISTKMSYAPDGQLRSMTDPLGRTTNLDYTNGCLTRITNPLGFSTMITCNAAGQPDSISDALSNISQLHYLGTDLVSMTDPLGRSVRFRHDVLGRTIAEEDAQGNLTRREYDPEGRMIKLVDASGSVTELGYDANGNMTAILMPNGSGITYDYDERDRLIRRTDNLGRSETWSWDGMGKAQRYTDRNQQTTTFEYDALSRQTSTRYSDGTMVVAAYDAGNRLLSLNDSDSGRLSWFYDELDRVIEATSPQGNISYEYDAVGRRTAMAVASQAKIEYRYDDGDRLTRMLQGSEAVDFDYDAINRLTKRTLPNGISTGYSYNAASDLAGMAWINEDGGLLHDLGYGYDSTGRRVVQTGSLAPRKLPLPSTDNEFDDGNQQNRFNGQDLTYDANGNLKSDGSRSYVWNPRNQLVAVKEGGTTIARFAYDSIGRRYEKTERGEVTAYLYDGLDPVQEVQDGQVIPVLTGQGVDQRLARGSGSQRHFYLSDALGSTRALADIDGSILQTYDYDPYGVTHPTNQGVENPYRYTGREQDESGLYYYRARYYSPELGRFISEDPIGMAGGDINFYAYVGGDPISYSDPLGLSRAGNNHAGRTRSSWNSLQRSLGGSVQRNSAIYQSLPAQYRNGPSVTYQGGPSVPGRVPTATGFNFGLHEAAENAPMPWGAPIVNGCDAINCKVEVTDCHCSGAGSCPASSDVLLKSPNCDCRRREIIIFAPRP
ncbi:RHS repeat-associated core domain-containing protein [Luteimonas fraxinea]|uniref:RHS repeat-associated core domain-containing protein n=1 Tax=Luteimonas fraxinea TaxID=2901869 RepID=UPI001E46D446|nr:RHS repeat-associated core domain-containing protein [Luteimonas fraxinea]MCD9127655.1 DUF6531 domain-containing protein [Luteimonas fraxinea]